MKKDNIKNEKYSIYVKSNNVAINEMTLIIIWYLK